MTYYHPLNNQITNENLFANAIHVHTDNFENEFLLFEIKVKMDACLGEGEFIINYDYHLIIYIDKYI